MPCRDFCDVGVAGGFNINTPLPMAGSGLDAGVMIDTRMLTLTGEAAYVSGQTQCSVNCKSYLVVELNQGGRKLLLFSRDILLHKSSLFRLYVCRKVNPCDIILNVLSRNLDDAGPTTPFAMR